MAQTGYTPISIYYSATSTNVPTAGNLVAGELAINTADGKLFYKDSAGVVQVIGTKGGVGSSTTTQILYNSSGLVVGSANMTFNGTSLTLANDASISGLTVGKGAGSLGTNTVLGASALTSNSAGQRLTAIGTSALAANTASDNTGVGYLSLNATTSGVSNAAFGAYSAALNTTGQENVAAGSAALYTNTTGSSNVAVGRSALFSNTTASSGTAVGYQAAYSANGDSGISAFGYQAAYNTQKTIDAFGYQAAYANTSGINNSAFGILSLGANTTGSYNVALGRQSLASNTTAANNTAVGYQAAYSTNSSTANITALGFQSAYTCNTASIATAIGNAALANGANIDGCTAVGYQAGLNCANSGNTFLGSYAGSNLANGQNNLYIGNYTRAGSTTASQELVIAAAYNTAGKGTNTGYINAGGGNIYQGNNSTLWSITSDQRIKENIVNLENGLSTIMALRPVEFDYIETKKHDISFIAQEYQKVLPDQVTEHTASDAEKAIAGTDILLGLTPNLVPYLVKAIQELKAEIDQLKGNK